MALTGHLQVSTKVGAACCVGSFWARTLDASRSRTAKSADDVQRYGAEIVARMVAPMAFIGSVLGVSSVRGVGFPLYQKWVGFNQVQAARESVKDSAIAVGDTVSDTAGVLLDKAKPFMIGVGVFIIVAIAVHGWAGRSRR